MNQGSGIDTKGGPSPRQGLVGLMTAKEEFAAFMARMDELKTARDSISEELAVLEASSDKLRARLIKEEGVLAKKPFTHAGRFGGLGFHGKLKDFPELYDYLNFSYHDDCPLVWEGNKPVVRIRFDDNDISFQFEDNKYVAPFIKDFGIRINASGLKKELRDAKSKVESLEAIIDTVKAEYGESMEE